MFCLAVPIPSTIPSLQLTFGLSYIIVAMSVGHMEVFSKPFVYWTTPTTHSTSRNVVLTLKTGLTPDHKLTYFIENPL